MTEKEKKERKNSGDEECSGESVGCVVCVWLIYSKENGAMERTIQQKQEDYNCGVKGELC